MSVGAVTANGVKFEFWPGDTKDPCRAKMRNHFGMGATFTAACDDLIRSIQKELETAKAAKAAIEKHA